MQDIDRRIINQLQDGFPLCARPYEAAAQSLGLNETDLISRLRQMLDNGTLTRFGPLYNADRMGGANVLAAMTVPLERFDTVAEQVNAHPEIAHNYARESVSPLPATQASPKGGALPDSGRPSVGEITLNMWFVAAAPTVEAVEQTFCAIETETGLTVHRFPKEREFFVEFKLELKLTA